MVVDSRLDGGSMISILLRNCQRRPRPCEDFDRRATATQILFCQTVGWPLSAATRGEESPGSTEVRCRVTPGGGDPRESATESTPPLPAGRNSRRGGKG